MASKHHVIGWKLDPGEREALLRQLPAAYPDVVADHVTLQSYDGGGRALPQDAAGEIIGQTDDGRGVQAMVVRIDGTTERPGGGTYHITWSLDRAQGRRAVESNAVIAERGWTALPRSYPVRLGAAHLS